MRAAVGCGAALALSLALVGCGGPGGSDEATERTPETGEAVEERADGVEAGDAPSGELQPADTAGGEAERAGAETEEASAGEAEVSDEEATPGGAAAVDTTPPGGEKDGSREEERIVGRYYVTVRPDADPAEVAAEHGIEPIDVIRERTKAFYAPLTAAQKKGLEEDSLVVSLARELHGPAEDTFQVKEIPPTP